jgi:hypothetical protein
MERSSAFGTQAGSKKQFKWPPRRSFIEMRELTPSKRAG